MTFEFNKEDLTRYYLDNYKCWVCGMNGWDCFHHIIPRSDSAECSSSIFNSAPLHNHKCHLPNHGKLTNEDWRKILLQKTAKYLFSQKIILKEIDKKFLYENKDYYL